MQHDTFIERISLWFDDQLNSAEVARLQTHLIECATCRQTYQAMQQVDDLFRNAATVIAAPNPGFPDRVEARLVQYDPYHQRNLWLGLGVLLLSTLLFIIVAATLGSITLINLRDTLFNGQALYLWLMTVIESVDYVRAFLNLGSLFAKAGLMILSQPVFWISVLVAISLAGLWVRLIQLADRRVPGNVELLI